jgi:hypothetical protein
MYQSISVIHLQNLRLCFADPGNAANNKGTKKKGATNKGANKGAKNAAQNPSQHQHLRDKFTALAVPEMPPSIVAWADALAKVDQSVTPYTSNPLDRRYVLPEPALLLNTTPERRRMFLHHWKLLSDGFVYVLSQPGHAQLLTAQEWRDVLEGQFTKRGGVSTRVYRWSEGLEERLRPALEASNVSSLEGFPVPVDELPQFTLEETQEIVWRVAETNFRFEFMSLDGRASGRNRWDEVRGCFAGGMLLEVPLEMASQGWAAAAIETRHKYVMRTATLMLDWTTKSPLPRIIRRVAVQVPWSPTQMEELEIAVCEYYTQSFWEYFGRAAVVPLRLKEKGEL